MTSKRYDATDFATDWEPDLATPILVWQKKCVGEIRVTDTEVSWNLTPYEAAFVLAARQDEEGCFTFDIEQPSGTYHYVLNIERSYSERNGR